MMSQSVQTLWIRFDLIAAIHNLELPKWLLQEVYCDKGGQKWTFVSTFTKFAINCLTVSVSCAGYMVHPLDFLVF